MASSHRVVPDIAAEQSFYLLRIVFFSWHCAGLQGGVFCRYDRRLLAGDSAASVWELRDIRVEKVGTVCELAQPTKGV